MSTELAIDVKGLNKTFGDKHVVKDFSIRFRAAHHWFSRTNGSGKTQRSGCSGAAAPTLVLAVPRLRHLSRSDAIKLRVGP
jgi:ABC-2 type transport system ATP-binding protein